MLDKVVKENPGYAEDQRVKSLRWWFGSELDKRVRKGIGQTTEWYKDGSSSTQGRMLFLTENAQRYLAEGVLTDKRLADDEWATRAGEDAEKGLEAAQSLVIFYKDYYGKNEPVYIKAASDLRGLADRIREGAAGQLRDSRMPTATSTASDLLAIAKEVVAKAGAGPFERMIINYGPADKSEARSDARIEGDYIKIWKWTEVWKEFQVALAEKVGADYRIVYYTIKKIDQGPSWLILNRWYCSSRIESRKILKENIGK